ncbi:neck protein [Vibrio phage 1.009.O._10N.261.51.C9]|nr:neck protein [Vibrio phage 1.009.O._10N.261.51.C9]
MFEINGKELKRLEQQLDQVAEFGLQHAQRNTLNDYAFGTQRQAKQNIRDQFTNRNRWTERSVQVDKASRFVPSSEVGSTEDYMREQEFGARTESPIHVPTPAASGESVRANKRLRPVRKNNRMNNINLKGRSRRAGGLTRKQQNIAAVRQAADEGRKFVYLDRGKRKGIFRLYGGKRRPRTRLIQDLSRRVRVVPKNQWLAPASDKVMARAGETYYRHLAQQLRRAGAR